MTPLTVGSLFSGIGGLDLGLERAGMTVVWQSEIDPYCTRVLAKHWPDVPNLGDVTTIDWTVVPRVDLICGGYPCQPFSVAGRRQGEQDPRHLWPYMLDAVRVLRPRYALLENVPGHLALGFGRVLGDLAEIGYDTEWDCIPAAAIGAPHLRWRVFIAATRRRDSLARRTTETLVAIPTGEHDREPARGRRAAPTPTELAGQRSGAVADPDSPRLEGRGLRRPTPERSGAVADANGDGREGRGLPEGRRGQTVPDPDRGGPRIFGRASRPGGQWAAEPDVGRVAHGIPHRVDRLKGLGNAVVPQVAEHIGRLILEAAA